MNLRSCWNTQLLHLLALGALLAGLALGPAQSRVAHAATTIAVTTTADELNSDGDCSLREAIHAANLDSAVDACPAGNGSDTITLPSGTFTLTIAPDTTTEARDRATGDLDIVSNIQFNGAGRDRTILDGNQLDRVIEIFRDPLTTDSYIGDFQKLTIRNGRAAFGGAILNAGLLGLFDALVSGNTATGSAGRLSEGGAIYNTGRMFIRSTTLTNNTSAGFGYRGGRGGGIFNQGGTVNLTDSSVDHNVARSGASTDEPPPPDAFFAGSGGGIINSGTLNLTNTAIDDNIADANKDYFYGNAAEAGGIRQVSGSITMTGGSISRNAAKSALFEASSGGGIVIEAGAVNLSGMVMSGNQVESEESGRGGSSGAGAALLIEGGTVTISSSTISGGGILNKASLSISDSTINQASDGAILNVQTLTIINSTISDNAIGTIFNPGDGAAPQDGAGIANGGTATISGSTFQRNTGYGGSAIENRGTLSIDSSAFLDNTALACECADGYIVGGGGAIKNTGALKLTNSLFERNSAAIGGAILSRGTLSIATTTIRNNQAQDAQVQTRGGGLAITAGTAAITDTTIYNNTASGAVGGSGGGISNAGTLSISTSTISGNAATGGSTSGVGGGIANSGTLTLLSATIANNRVTGRTGDGVNTSAGGVDTSGSATIHNTLIATNQSSASSVRGVDCAGTITSLGYNLIGNTQSCTLAGTTTGDLLNISPQIGPLQNNGGPTLTHALLIGSPAIDAGDPAQPDGYPPCPLEDQRGVPGFRDGDGNGSRRCDIGAYEFDRSGTPPILRNGSFETDSNADGTPDGWSSDLRVTRTTATRQDGMYALQHRATDNASYTIFSDARPGITPGAPYSFSGYYNVPATGDSFSLEFQVRWRDAANNVIATVPVATLSATTSGWVNTTATVIAPANAAFVQLRMAVTSLNATVYVDQLNLRPVENLLRNGGFESDSNGDGTPDGWSASPRATRSTAVVRSGQFALRHQASDNPSYTIFSDSFPSVVAGRPYSFAGWVNIPATSDTFSVELQVRWRDAANNVLSTVPVKTYTAATGGWTAATASLIAPPNAAQASVRMVVSSLNATVYVDDLTLGP